MIDEMKTFLIGPNLPWWPDHSAQTDELCGRFQEGF